MDCDCTDEYGPCEEHGTVLCQREGASTRTADELLEVFCYDAIGCGAETTPWGRDVLERVGAALKSNRRMGVAWLPKGTEGDGLRDELVSLVDQLETSLATMDEPISTFWEDGYNMVRISSDCPLLV